MLDRLESVAPVLAVRSLFDNRQHGERFESGSEQRVGGYTRVVEAGGLRIGVVHEFPRHGIPVSMSETFDFDFPDESIEDILASRFGSPVDVVAFGGTLKDLVLWYRCVLMVNPGSPNLPKTAPGTVAMLDIRNRVARVEVIAVS